MASAERVEIEPTPPPVEIVLSLTEREAQILKGVVANIRGVGGGERVVATDAIYAALGAAGVSVGAGDILVAHHSGGVQFKAAN